jgi:hypothetical protein
MFKIGIYQLDLVPLGMVSIGVLVATFLILAF